MTFDRATRLRLGYGRGRKLSAYQAKQNHPGNYFAVSKKFAGLILRRFSGEPDNACCSLYLGCSHIARPPPGGFTGHVTYPVAPFNDGAGHIRGQRSSPGDYFSIAPEFAGLLLRRIGS
jgi:hypothetical protein